MLNQKLKRKAEELGLEKFISMDVYFAKETSFNDKSGAEVNPKTANISIKKYNTNTIPVKNAMRPIHKMLDQDKLV